LNKVSSLSEDAKVSKMELERLKSDARRGAEELTELRTKCQVHSDEHARALADREKIDQELNRCKKSLETTKMELDQTKSTLTASANALAEKGAEVGQHKESIKQLEAQLKRSDSARREQDHKFDAMKTQLADFTEQ